jgi:hypothetical protein
MKLFFMLNVKKNPTFVYFTFPKFESLIISHASFILSCAVPSWHIALHADPIAAAAQSARANRRGALSVDAHDRTAQGIALPPLSLWHREIKSVNQ